MFPLWPAHTRQAGVDLLKLVHGFGGSGSVADSLMCRLPHRANGIPEEWLIWRFIGAYCLPSVRERQFTESGRNLLDLLRSEATRAGVCPNHVRILCGFVARAIEIRR
jgi:hypothetical protein